MRNQFDEGSSKQQAQSQQQNQYPKQMTIGDKTVTVYSPQEEQVASKQNQDYMKNFAGMPSRPEFDYLIDPNTGNLKQELLMADQMNTGALDQYRQEAMRDPGGQSQWAKMMQDQLGSQKAAAQDSLAQQSAGGRAQLLSDLASTGGANAGSRERALRGGQREQMLGNQRLGREFGDRGMNIGIQDEQNRINQLGSAVGFDQQRAGYLSNIDQFNKQGSLDEYRKKREDDLSAWDTQLSTWASNKQAESQAAAACFHPDTMIHMKDNSKKKIRDIKLGDHVLLGGEVQQMIIGKHGNPSDVYNYNGAIVTGQHAVRETGEFVRVKDSLKAKPADMHIPVVYNLVTENHVMLINDTIFADHEEVDVPKHPSETLRELNIEFSKAIS